MTLSDNEIAKLPYRKGVGMVLFNPAGQVFVARRIDMPSAAWQMPQGGIDEGESPRQAAFRELKEEIGTDQAKIIGQSKDWLSYDLSPELVPRIWNGCYRGQTQKWFAMEFSGTDADININTKNPEFSQWQWADFFDLPDLIVPFKRQLYRDIVAEFSHLAK